MDRAENKLRSGQIVDKEAARRAVQEHIGSMRTNPPVDLVILDDRTIETDFGWLFFWNSRPYIETGDYVYAIAGNAPFIVDRTDGSLHENCSAYSIEQIIEDYRNSRRVR